MVDSRVAQRIQTLCSNYSIPSIQATSRIGTEAGGVEAAVSTVEVVMVAATINLAIIATATKSSVSTYPSASTMSVWRVISAVTAPFTTIQISP